MNRTVKSIVAFATVLGLLGSAGVAVAASIASAGPNKFVPVAPADAPYIDHTFGRYVTNTNTASPQNVVADLGMVTGLTSYTVIVNAYHEPSYSADMACTLLVNDPVYVTETSGTVYWNLTEGRQSRFITFSGLNASRKYVITAFCSIPMNGGFGGSKIFAAWVE